MCGIVGYVGERDCIPIILEGLKRLEYRGYDSAGIAVFKNGAIEVHKKAGKVADLEASWPGRKNSPATVGMGHTRWATHGEPNDVNAHPHFDCKKSIAVIHNGVIENYRALKIKLESTGHSFRSETDTEVIPHIIEEFMAKTGNLTKAVRLTLEELDGTYGLVV